MSLLPPSVGSQQRLSGAQAEEWIIAATVPAAAPAGTPTPATLQRQATTAPQNQQFCPVREVWNIERIYTTGTVPTPDCQLVLFVDLVVQPYTPLASSVSLVQNRPAALARTIVVNGGSVVTAAIVNFTANANTTLGVLVNFLIQVMRASP
jgi:hypothetical protein